MKILGISGSSRGDQQSGCHKLAETALEASECEYELVSLRGKTILGCTGCLGCVEDNVCVLKDDMSPLRAKFVEADAFVIAAPNYFSGMNASTHAMLERLYQFRHREADTLWGKLAVAIGVGGGDGLPVADQIEGFIAVLHADTARPARLARSTCFLARARRSPRRSLPPSKNSPRSCRWPSMRAKNLADA
ncbi:MAG: flavodoxin family protein [Planctomycetota bacterium]|jgi:multimeric flavodoxin WrbA